jgi:hypothetical protein
LPLTFDSLHKTVDQIVTVPFLRNFIDTMCIFCGVRDNSDGLHSVEHT